MKKTISISAILLMAITAMYFTACNSNTTAPPANDQEDSLNKVLARGEYLTLHVAACMHCHSTRDFSKYSGPAIPGTVGGGGEKFDQTVFYAIPGTLYAKNITPDSATGIGTWTDAEIMRAITQGIAKNGDTLFPLMPYANYNRMAKDDLLSIIAYIRTLKPIHNEVPPRQLLIPISVAYPGSALQKSVDGNVRPSETDSVKYGGYLVTMAGCADCHNPYVKGQPDFSRSFAGGSLFNAGTFKVTAANITPDSTTGIGAWSEDQFLKKFTVCREAKGYDYNPGKLNTIMPLTAYAGMTDGDLKAIYAYMRTVKPVKNSVTKYQQ